MLKILMIAFDSDTMSVTSREEMFSVSELEVSTAIFTSESPGTKRKGR
jgi:hypothetical protein